jgi:hypothetical protein
MTAPAAGWYHDPADAGAWRWWDGAAWTDHIRPVEQAAQPAPAVVIEPVPTHAPVFEQPAPPAPEPAPAPEPVAVHDIPQPGQVASAPPAAPAPGTTSLTPAIPVTDQMYWHSSAAEMIEVPRLPHSGTGAIHVQAGPTPPSYVRDWNDLGSPSNGGIWLLAFSPVLYVAVAYLINFVNSLSGYAFGPFASAVAVGVATGLNWIFAYADMRSLRDRGYHPPAIWWMLLAPPLAYLIARGRAVRREGRRAWPAELVFVLCFLAVVGGVVLITMSLVALLGVPGL